MAEPIFKSDLEKRIWVAAYTRFEPKGYGPRTRMRNAWALVTDLRKSVDKLLAFGAWKAAGAEMVGEEGKKGESVFQNDIERDIWISAFTRPVPEGDHYGEVENRAKRAWEFVLDFRKPEEVKGEGWEQALHELHGKEF